ncbi:MAG: iron-containing alcohol dehydrogenase [Subtercola sp.]|nr:iron-containing alcohol dehydrogenase [Subtercola sp.]
MTMIRNDQARQTLLCGPASIAALPAELHQLDVTRVVLVSSPHASTSRGFQAVRQALEGFDIVYEFTAVRPHAPIVDTEALAAEVAGLDAGAFVAYGGGSVSDTAKAVSILLAEGAPLGGHCSTFTPPDQLFQPQLRRPKLPVVSVPTTLSGAEVTPGGGATDSAGIKRVFWDSKVASRVLIFDPLALQDVPPDIVLTSGMNGLAHCAEALYSRSASPVTDALALEGARRFAAALPTYAEGDRTDDLASELLLAAYFGGIVISNARVGLHHAVCHVLGALLGVPHGVANTVMLPYVLQFNADETEAKQQLLGLALAAGLGIEPGRPASLLVRDIQLACNLPTTLQEAGVRYEELDRVAEAVMQDRGLYFNPKVVTDASVVRALLENAYTGTLLAVAA